jgi:hypothetical protein
VIRLLIADNAELLDHDCARDRPFDEVAQHAVGTQRSDLANLNRCDGSPGVVHGIHADSFSFHGQVRIAEEPLLSVVMDVAKTLDAME